MIQSRDFPYSESEDVGKLSGRSQSSEDLHDEDSEQPQSSSNHSSDDESSQESSSHITKQEALQKQLLKIGLQNECKRRPFQKQIMGQIIDKLKNYQEAGRQKEGEQLVTLRIQQLVYNKLLVLTYGSTQFRLVLSHFRLGYAYLRHGCIDQAIQHISIAVHKNEKMFGELQEKNKLFHCIMKNILAQCLMKKDEYDDAIEILEKSLQLADTLQEQKSIITKQEVSNRSRILLTQCYCQHKQYDEALRIIEQVLENSRNVVKSQEDQAFALTQKANILASKNEFTQAIAAQDEAINILIRINYPKPQEVAEMYGKLSDFYEKIGNSELSLSSIQKLKTLYQQIYTPEDKRVIKARRRIATSLLKNDRFKQAVNQLLEIVELEEKVFGESSIQTARTLKLLGTVYIRLEKGDARAYLKRALNIFNALGNKKQGEEIKQKLKALMYENNNKNEMKVLSQHDL